MELLKELTRAFGPSGREEGVGEIIKKHISPYADEITSDALGNLIARKKGPGKKIMLAAHMDEIGVIVTFIDEKGFLKFDGVGGLNKKDIVYSRVIFENGTTGVIGTISENADRDIKKMYIDIGAASREEAEKLISIGDMAVFSGDFINRGDVVISKALDNRCGCAILIEVLKRVKSENDLYFVFTTQEEVGLRGAKGAAYGINPDLAVSVDVTDTGDTPGAAEMAVALGRGAAIKVMDNSVLCHPEVRCRLLECAKNMGMSYQLEVMSDGGTDAGAISLSGSGVKTGGVSVPTRHVHSPSEMINKKDMQSCTELLLEFVK